MSANRLNLEEPEYQLLNDIFQRLSSKAETTPPVFIETAGFVLIADRIEGRIKFFGGKKKSK